MAVVGQAAQRIGLGQQQLVAFARALLAMGYRGPVGMEAFAAGDPEVALSAFRSAFTI